MHTKNESKQHFSIRIPRNKLDKLKYIAFYNGRSANKEIEKIIEFSIQLFEKTNGEIQLDADKE